MDEEKPGLRFLGSIASVRVRGMVSRVCRAPKCGRRLERASTIRVCGGEFMCDGCCARSVVDGAYVLSVTIVKGNDLVKAVAFGGVVRDLVGMDAADYDKLAFKHPFIPSLFEMHLLGKFFYFSLSGKEKRTTHPHLEKDELIDAIDVCCTEPGRGLSYVPFIELTMVQRVLRVEAVKASKKEMAETAENDIIVDDDSLFVPILPFKHEKKL